MLKVGKRREEREKKESERMGKRYNLKRKFI